MKSIKASLLLLVGCFSFIVMAQKADLVRDDYEQPDSDLTVIEKVKAKLGKKKLTIFQAAAAGFYKEAADILKKDKKLVKMRDDRGNTPLHYAKNLQIIKLLLQNGADINAKNDAGLTRLHLDVVAGHPVLVRFLLNNGANVNAKDSRGVTPLHLATMISYFEDPKEALAASGLLAGEAGAVGATAGVATIAGTAATVGTTAAASTAVSTEALLAAAAAAVDTMGVTELIAAGGVAPEVGAFTAAMEGTVPTAVATAAEAAGVSALGVAAMWAAIVVAAIVTVDIEIRNGILTDLIFHGANVAAQDMYGNTALHTLASGPLLKPGNRHGGVTMAKNLINAGASLRTKNKADQTPYDVAKANKRVLLMPVLNPALHPFKK